MLVYITLKGEKYEKFKIRAEIIKDPNKKQCPKADCQYFLEKSPSTKNVKCKKGHEYCFECLRPPHGKSSCEELMEKDFLKWKKKRFLKKCPRCQIFTEKNEGCNHMTCSSCKYQWCWLCLGKYTYGHYDQGQCQGHQFTNEEWEKLQNSEDFTDVNGQRFTGVERVIGMWNCRHVARSIFVGVQSLAMSKSF